MKRNAVHGAYGHFRAFLCLSALFLLYISLCAQSVNKTDKSFGKTKILFSEISWEEALKKAAATHKRAFVDAYASWCGPCKLLKATTFTNQEAALFFNQHFINLSIDMEKGDGVNLAAKWDIQAYPTLIIFDTTGEPVLETVGFLKPEDLLTFGKQALAKKKEQQ